MKRKNDGSSTEPAAPGSSSGAPQGPYVPIDGSAAMTGNLRLANKDISGVKAFRPNNTNVMMSRTTTASIGLNNILIGNPTMVSNSSADTIHIGSNSTAIIAPDKTILIGNSASVSGEGSLVLGYESNCAGGSDNVVIGRNAQSTQSGGSAGFNTIVGSQASSSSSESVVVGNFASTNSDLSVVVGASSTSSANRADIFGAGLNNNQANSLLIAAESNVRPFCKRKPRWCKFNESY